eukprot:69526-Rhodomonas_salina.4
MMIPGEAFPELTPLASGQCTPQMKAMQETTFRHKLIGACGFLSWIAQRTCRVSVPMRVLAWGMSFLEQTRIATAALRKIRVCTAKSNTKRRVADTTCTATRLRSCARYVRMRALSALCPYALAMRCPVLHRPERPTMLT